MSSASMEALGVAIGVFIRVGLISDRRWRPGHEVVLFVDLVLAVGWVVV